MRNIALMIGMGCLAAASCHGAMAQDGRDLLSGVSAAMTSCTSDEMCIVVDSLPCGCAQGGRHEALNVGYKDLWASIGQYLQSAAPGIMCMQQFNCTERPRAACVSGHCRAVTD